MVDYVITDQQCSIQGVPSLTWTTILETPQIMPLYLNLTHFEVSSYGVHLPGLNWQL